MMGGQVKDVLMGRGRRGVGRWRGWWVAVLFVVLGLCGWLWAQEELTSKEAGDSAAVAVEAAVAVDAAVASEGQSEGEAESEAASEEASPRPTIEALKKLVVEKNIFRPGKLVYAAGWEPAAPMGNSGPQQLKKPFMVDAIVRDMGKPVVFLSFGETSKSKAAYEGDVFEEMVTIVSIEGSYIVCEYGGREVRIGTNESSDDGWRRLVGEQKDYVFGWAVLEGGKTAAACVFEQGKSSSVIKVHEGEHLGKAQVVKIEARRVQVRFADGREDTIE